MVSFEQYPRYVLVNPFLYPQPLFRTIALGLFRRWAMTGQAMNPQWRIPDLSTRLRILPQRIFRDYPAVYVEFFNELLTALGLYVLIRGAWRWLRGKESMFEGKVTDAGTGVAILVVAAVTALTPLFTPLDWDRYYMYPIRFHRRGCQPGLDRTPLAGPGCFVHRAVNGHSAHFPYNDS